MPRTPGVEGVGVVAAPGTGVRGPAPGTRVVLLKVIETWRERVACPADRVLPVTDTIADEDAAQAVATPLTAWRLCPTVGGNSWAFAPGSVKFLGKQPGSAPGYLFQDDVFF